MSRARWMMAGAAAMWFADPTSGAQRRRSMKARTHKWSERARRISERHDRKSRKLNDVDSSNDPGGSVGAPGAVPGDPASMADIVGQARTDGFPAEMTISAIPGTNSVGIECGNCHVVSRPAAMTRLWLHRLEGATDPDDMSTVSALRCPACGEHGLLVTSYGPEADADEAEVLVALPAPLSADMSPYEFCPPPG